MDFKNIDQDQLRTQILHALAETSPERKRMNIKELSAQAGLCATTVNRFIDGRQVNRLSLMRLAMFMEKFNPFPAMAIEP